MSEHCGLHNKPFNPVGNDWRVTALICPDCEALKKREAALIKACKYAHKVISFKAGVNRFDALNLLEAALEDK